MDKSRKSPTAKIPKDKNTYRALGLLAESMRISILLVKLLHSNSISKDFFGSVSEFLSLIIKIILGL